MEKVKIRFLNYKIYKYYQRQNYKTGISMIRKES